jgi:hypothetical protein
MEILRLNERRWACHRVQFGQDMVSERKNALQVLTAFTQSNLQGRIPGVCRMPVWQARMMTSDKVSEDATN